MKVDKSKIKKMKNENKSIMNGEEIKESINKEINEKNLENKDSQIISNNEENQKKEDEPSQSEIKQNHENFEKVNPNEIKDGQENEIKESKIPNSDESQVDKEDFIRGANQLVNHDISNMDLSKSQTHINEDFIVSNIQTEIYNYNIAQFEEIEKLINEKNLKKTEDFLEFINGNKLNMKIPYEKSYMSCDDLSELITISELSSIENNYYKDILIDYKNNNLHYIKLLSTDVKSLNEYLSLFFYSYLEKCVLLKKIPSLFNKNIEYLDNYHRTSFILVKESIQTFIDTNNNFDDKVKLLDLLRKYFIEKEINILELGMNLMREEILRFLLNFNKKVDLDEYTEESSYIWECMKSVINLDYTPEDINKSIISFITYYFFIQEDLIKISFVNLSEYNGSLEQMDRQLGENDVIFKFSEHLIFTIYNIINNNHNELDEISLGDKFYLKKEYFEKFAKYSKNFTLSFVKCLNKILVGRNYFNENLNIGVISNFLIDYKNDKITDDKNVDNLITEINEIYEKLLFNLKTDDEIIKLIDEITKLWNKRRMKIQGKREKELYIGNELNISEKNICVKCKRITNCLVILSCNHEVCDKCLKKYIIFLTNGNIINNRNDNSSVKLIKCPIIDCYYFLNRREIYSPFRIERDFIIQKNQNFELNYLEDEKFCLICKSKYDINKFHENNPHYFCDTCVIGYIKYIFKDQMIRSDNVYCPIKFCNRKWNYKKINSIMNNNGISNNNNIQNTIESIINMIKESALVYSNFKSCHRFVTQRCKGLKHEGVNIISLEEASQNKTHKCTLCEVCVKDIQDEVYSITSNLRGYYSSMDKNYLCPCCGNIISLEELNNLIIKFNRFIN